MLYKSHKRATVKDVDMKGRTITGYFSAFDNIDRDGDIIVQGAYAKSISDMGPEGTDEIWHLDQHDPRARMGKPRTLREDNFGLYFETPLPEGRAQDDLLTLYDFGLINNHSVGIDILERDKDDSRLIKQVRLWEGSTVTWGANPNTPSTGVKAYSPGAILHLEELIKRYDRVLTLNLSDETCKRLEREKQVIEAEYEHASDQAPSGEGPPKSIRTEDGPHLDWDWMNEQLDTFHSYLTRS